MDYQEGSLPPGEAPALRGAARSSADFAFLVVVTARSPAAIDEVAALAREGHGLKVFMVSPRFVERTADYLDLYRAAAAAGVVVAVHAEDRAVIDRATAQLHAAGRTGAEWFPESRPVQAEIVAVRAALAHAELSGAALYLVHLSSRGALDGLREGKERGARLETLLPMLYSEGVRRGRLTLARLVEVLATAPARIAGLHPRKGVLAPGSDADVVVFDPNARRTIRSSEMHSACDYDPYEGWDVTGWPEVVLSRGEVVFERGTVTARPGRGRFVPRARYGEP